MSLENNSDLDFKEFHRLVAAVPQSAPPIFTTKSPCGCDDTISKPCATLGEVYTVINSFLNSAAASTSAKDLVVKLMDIRSIIEIEKIAAEGKPL